MLQYRAIGGAYNEKEHFGEIGTGIQVAGQELDEAAVLAAIEALIASVGVIKRMYAAHDGDDLESHGLWLLTFTIVLKEGAQVIASMEEDAFLRAAAELEAAREAIVAFALAVICGQSRGRRYIWRDEETPAGAAGMVAVAAADAQYIDAYIRFLRSNDLDHEVHQEEDIDKVIGAHGWCDATFRLAIARAVSCAGQFGGEQIEQLAARGLRSYAHAHEHEDSLYELVPRELREWPYMAHLDQGCRTSEELWNKLDPWSARLAHFLPASWLSRLRRDITRRAR